MRKGRAGGALGAILALAAAAALAALAAPAAAAVDTAPPVLLSASPADGAYFNATASAGNGLVSIPVHASLQDVASGINTSNVSVALTDEAAGAPVDPGTLSVTAVGTHVDVAGAWLVRDGAYRLSIMAVDNAGNTASFERRYTVDTVPPVLEVSAPAVVESGTATVRIDARDAGSGPALPVFLSYKSSCGNLWATKRFEATQLPGRVVGEASFPLCVGANNQFTVAVQDKAGNAASATQRKVAYDLAPPVFSGFSPGSFVRVDGPRVQLSAQVTDDATGVNASTVEVQVSQDGGVTWGPWIKAAALGGGLNVRVTADLTLADGAIAGVRWRATDLAGHGPSESAVQFFYLNGPPFVVAFEPSEGAVVPEFSAVRLWAEFADPDADTVLATFRSDIDGPLGRADGKRVQLSVGVHNLTLTGYDGHGHWVNYTYEVVVQVRPPPDTRPLLLTGVLAGVMVWAAYAAWAREREEAERAAGAPKA